jgi:hypothetical protein
MATEKDFCTEFAGVLWRAMSITSKGYRRHSLKHTGRGNDRRADKLKSDGSASKVSNKFRAYANRRGV